LAGFRKRLAEYSTPCTIWSPCSACFAALMFSVTQASICCSQSV